MKILISPSSFGKCGIEPLQILEKTNYELIHNPYGRKLTEKEVVELGGKELVGIVAGVEPLNQKVLDQLPHLKCISRVGVGLDSVDLKYAENIGVKVISTPDGPTRAVAELTIGLAMNLLRCITIADSNLKQKKWKKEIGNLILNKKVGIFGLGRIGKETAKLFQNLGASIQGYDLYPDHEYLKNNDINLVSIEELFESSDIISVHVPGSKNNEPIINMSELSLMKETAYLINVSRGGVVEEKALYRLLEKKKIAGAALDVFLEEPYDGDFLKLNNVILTPHLGSYALEGKLKMEIDAVNNLINFLNKVK
jgi:D-3-phosphoglycerate dehydrogenase